MNPHRSFPLQHPSSISTEELVPPGPSLGQTPRTQSWGSQKASALGTVPLASLLIRFVSLLYQPLEAWQELCQCLLRPETGHTSTEVFSSLQTSCCSVAWQRENSLLKFVTWRVISCTAILSSTLLSTSPAFLSATPRYLRYGPSSLPSGCPEFPIGLSLQWGSHPHEYCSTLRSAGYSPTPLSGALQATLPCWAQWGGFARQRKRFANGELDTLSPVEHLSRVEAGRPGRNGHCRQQFL